LGVGIGQSSGTTGLCFPDASYLAFLRFFFFPVFLAFPAFPDT
jgi:hypothetical protein